MINNKIGGGAYGGVYSGWKKTDHKETVAFKEIQVEFEETSRKEITIMQKASDHRNIIQLLDFITTERLIYIVIEYCGKGDLINYIKEKHRLHLEEKMDVMMQCAEGVNHLHNMDPTIIHRDMKPQNILIKTTPRGEVVVKITDFGMAKILLENQENMNTSSGTFKFRAPELFNKSRGSLSYTKAIDVFSLGLVYVILVRHDGKESESFEPYDNLKEGYLFFGQKLLQDKNAQLFELSIIKRKEEVPLYKLITEMVKADFKKRYDMNAVVNKLNEINQNIQKNYYDKFELAELLQQNGLNTPQPRVSAIVII